MDNRSLARAAPAVLLAASLLLALSAQVWAAPALDISVSYAAPTYTITVEISNMSKGKNYYLKYYSPSGLQATHGPFYQPGSGSWDTTDVLVLEPSDLGGKDAWKVELYEEATLKKSKTVDVIDTVWTTDSTYAAVRTSFLQGETVYVKGIGYDPNHGGGSKKGMWYLKFFYGATLKHTSTWITATSTWDITYSYALPSDAPTGTWTVKVYCAQHDALHGSTTFNVVQVCRNVSVEIFPSSRSGTPGETLSYEVVVKNMGNVDDDYRLTVSDTRGWGPTISPTSLSVPAGENRAATLSVTVPSDAPGGAEDNMTVEATSQENVQVSDRASCIARAMIVRGVQVVISPPRQGNENGGTLKYDVTVTNTGNIQENFLLDGGDELGWALSLDDAWLLIPKGESRMTKLTVFIPPNAKGCTWNNIWVKATSKDNGNVFDNSGCLAHVRVVKGVMVTISPSYQSGMPGQTLSYEVVVTNTGNVDDGFDLRVDDDARWDLALDDTSLEEIPAGGSGRTTLWVQVPIDALGCTDDNIVIIARSRSDPATEGSAICVAHASIARGVDVSISPSYQSGLPGSTLSYAVTVANLGNASDTFDLTASDDAGWSLNISPSSLTLAAGASGSALLTVAVPASASGCTLDNVTVVATSAADPSISDSAGCVAHAAIVRAVSVSISPSSRTGSPGDTLTFTVTVRNEGNIDDTYALTVSDNAGWSPSVQPSSLAIGAGSEAQATLSVTIPGGAADKEEDLIGLVATSEADPSASGSANCVAQATVAPPPPSPPATPTPSTQPSRGVSISISPTSASAPPGGTLTYVVTIVNLGSEEDAFSVSSNGSAGWRSGLSRTYMVLAPGEVGQAILLVEVDAYASAGASATIEVAARSASDPSVRDSAEALVTASSLGSTYLPTISSAGGWAAPPMPASFVPLGVSFASSIMIVLLSLYLLLPLRAKRAGGRKYSPSQA